MKKSTALSFGSVLVFAAQVAKSQTTFTNPIAANGADPWVQLSGGNYYYTDTTGGNVSVASASTLAGVGTAAMTPIYTPPAGAGNVWAPELHQINGTWYAYYSMTTASSDHRMYVLQANTSNPQGAYTYKGQITDPTNLWSIDGTVMKLANGNLYFIWSGWPGATNGVQNLYIAPMSNPWTISGSRVLISSPNNSWEQQGGPPTINEGPEVLTSHDGGTTSIIYSASGSWTNNYCLGQLTLTGADPLDPASWTKASAGPVFASANGVFGPGHASYTTSDNGTRDWIVYHAAKTSGSGWDRNVRAQPFSWNPDGTPSFGQPVPVTVPIQWGPVSWIGAINGTANDSVHRYSNTANWVAGAMTDSFANVTLTDNTNLYFNADRTTASDMVFTYGSGQKTLSLLSDSSTTRTLTLTGNVSVNVLGGSNRVYLGSVSNPLVIAMGAEQRTFNIAADDAVSIDSDLTGSGGATITGGGSLILRGTKTFSGPISIITGSLAAGDGSAPSSSTNLPPGASITLGSGGTLILNGLTGSTTNLETVVGLSGTGTVNAALNSDALRVAIQTASTFAGALTGSKLSIIQAGPSTLTLSGNSSYSGTTTVTSGTLNVTGTIANTSSLFVKQGAATIAASGSVITSSYSSIGQSAGDNGTLNVFGTLNIAGDMNIADVAAAGVMNLYSGAALSCRTLSIGKYLNSSGTVNQTGGTLSALTGGGDWRVGGSSSADTAAIGVYNLLGGSLNTGGYNFQVGAYGTGTFVQSAGTVTSGGYIAVGRFPSGTGNYNLSGGTLTAVAQPALIVGEQGNGTLRVSTTGSVTAVSLSLGHDGGIGTILQSGGSVSLTSNVLLGRLAGGNGTYVLSGGTLTTAAVTRGAGTGTFDFNGGTLIPTASNASFLQGLSTAAVQTGGAIFNTSGFNITVAQPLIHDVAISGNDGGLTKLGAGTLTLSGQETYNGDTRVAGGNLVFAPNTSGNMLVRSVGNVTVAAGSSLLAGALGLTAGVSKSLLVSQSTVNVNGTLDLGVNDMVVKGGNLAVLMQSVQRGYQNGNWAGTGITSSTASLDSQHLTALGIIANTTGSGALYTSFDTQAVSAGDILIRYTYVGDSNLDGKVDGSDYSRIDTGYLLNASGWYNGDYNFDNVINGSDYTLIDNVFNRQGARITSDISDPSARVTSQISLASVPEPAALSSVMLLGGLMGGLLARRRRWSV